MGKRFLEISMLIPSTKMDLILSTFMPTPTSNTTAVESLTMNLAPNSLTIMPSMLDTAPAKDTGPSATHGPHHGENKDTSESSLDLTSVTVRNMPGTQKSRLLILLIVKNYN